MSTTDTSVLRSHTGDVLSLCYLPYGSTYVLLSGGSDGTCIVWDGVYHTQLLSWIPHTGGVLSLQALPGSPSSHGDFISQGRDGCVHFWEWADDEEEDAGSGSEMERVIHTPTKLRTVHVDFGGFCPVSILHLGLKANKKVLHGLHDLEAEENASPSLLLLASASHATCGIDVWCFTHGNTSLVDKLCRPIATISVGVEDAIEAARALLEENLDSTTQRNDILTKAGTPTCISLLHDVWTSFVPHYIVPSLKSSFIPVPANTSSVYTNPDGSPVHPEAPGGLRGMLDICKVQVKEEISPFMIDSAMTPFLLVSSYESGSLFVLKPKPSGESETLILFPLSKHAILTFTLCPDESDTDTLLGVAGTSGPLLYTFALYPKEKRGVVLGKIPLSSPGASACVSYPLGSRLDKVKNNNTFFVGCWDGTVKCVFLAKADGSLGEEHTSHSETSLNCESSVYSVACFYNNSGCVELSAGTKGGKVYLQRTKLPCEKA